MIINSINNYHPTVKLDAMKKQNASKENSLIFTIFNSLLQTAKNLIFNNNRPISLVKTMHQLHSNSLKSFAGFNKNSNTAKNLIFNNNRPISLVKTMHQLHSNSLKSFAGFNKNSNFEDRKLDDSELTRETPRLYKPISTNYTPIKYSPNNYKLFNNLFKTIFKK